MDTSGSRHRRISYTRRAVEHVQIVVVILHRWHASSPRETAEWLESEPQMKPLWENIAYRHAGTSDRPVPPQRADRPPRHSRQLAERRPRAGSRSAGAAARRAADVARPDRGGYLVGHRPRLAPPPRGCQGSDRRDSRSTLRPRATMARWWVVASTMTTTCSWRCRRRVGRITSRARLLFIST